jgi:DNA invertase Pin-like site-specific DNA recombinase
MGTCIGYIRASSEEQAGHGASLEAEKIRVGAVVQGVELADLIVDAAESAKSLDGPGSGS